MTSLPIISSFGTSIPISQIKNEEIIESISFSFDSNFLVTCNRSGILTLYNSIINKNKKRFQFGTQIKIFNEKKFNFLSLINKINFSWIPTNSYFPYFLISYCMYFFLKKKKN